MSFPIFKPILAEGPDIILIPPCLVEIFDSFSALQITLDQDFQNPPATDNFHKKSSKN